MASNPLASPADLEASWRPLTISEAPRAAALLSYASAKLRRELSARGRDADAEAQDDPVLAELLRSTCCSMVRRAMSAGTGAEVSQQSQTVGPLSVQYTYANAAGNVDMTKAERRDLGIPVRASRVAFVRPWEEAGCSTE